MHDKNQTLELAKQHAQQQTLYAAQKIDQALSELSTIAHNIASDISMGTLKRKHILTRLQETVKTTPNLFGIGVAFVPYVNHPETRKHSQYYVTQEKKVGESEQALKVFTVPIIYFDTKTQIKTILGVVFIDYLLSNIKDLMESLEVGRTGYGFILSEKGVFIAHPIDDYVKESQTIFHLAESYHDDALWSLAEKAIDGESGVVDYQDQMTGQSAWIFYQFIPSTHWSMGIVFFKDVLESSSLQRKLVRICVLSVIFLILLSTLLFRVDRGTNASLWKMVTTATLILMAGTAFLWYITQTAPFIKEQGSTMIVDKVGLQQFIGTKEKTSQKTFYYVPTGIFIESIEFVGNNNVHLSGYIWQKYTTDIHNDLSRGFILPEAKESKIVKSYHLTENSTEIIGWYFQATVPHQFNHKKYPLDRRQLNLRISHKDFNKNVILTPDLESYGVTNPTARPGVKRELVLSGWLVLKSFFNYQNHYEDTNLGMDNYIGHSNFSHLHFTILLKREFLAPFINNILPLAIACSLLFALQMWLGKTTTFLRTLSGIFFALLLAHIRLRGAVTTPDIIYIEWFYFVVYGSIIGLILTYFLYEYKIPIGAYREGLILKLLFLPLIVLSAFIITIVIFYI
ncbi:MAG: Cache 3/Cache 2 fusion domain-containing protein [Thiomargarita sp.]|nr:Cache 3/Cache 2 fusion domain-containing protein [Thiomargarita sp.]